jgi:hypothetical protein
MIECMDKENLDAISDLLLRLLLGGRFEFRLCSGNRAGADRYIGERDGH